MLKAYLAAIPCTKFIIIEDSLQKRGTQLYEYLLKLHSSRERNKVHCCVFEGNFERKKRLYIHYDNVIMHDFVTDLCKWLKGKETEKNFEDLMLRFGENCVVVVDSIANMIFHYGLAETYRIFNSLKNNRGIQQIVGVLHRDLIEGDSDQVLAFFEHISTLSMNIEPKCVMNRDRLSYTYKKTGGRIIRQIEEFTFSGGNLVTEEVKKPNLKEMALKTVSKEVNPETLSTFRIGLTDEEKISRDKVVLPYLPKTDNATDSTGEGSILYQLDNIDDWDEEDPDDDLEI